jgi:hypothetical protein
VAPSVVTFLNSSVSIQQRTVKPPEDAQLQQQCRTAMTSVLFIIICGNYLWQLSVVSATASLSSAVEESSSLSGVVAGSSDTLTWAQLSAKVLPQKQQTQHKVSNIRLKGMANETSV